MQSTDGICVMTQTSPTRMTSNIYVSANHVIPGKYYFDCNTEDGAVVPTEVVVCK